MITAEEIREQIRRNGYIEPIDVPRDGRPGTQPRPATKAPKSKAASGRFQILNQFVDESMQKLGQVAQATWIVLYRETKADGTAKVSHNQIANLIGVKRRAVIRATAELVKAGLLEVVKRGNASDHSPSTYRVKGRAI